MPEELKTGKYKHYKGKLYQVLGVARHTETDEFLVAYQALYDSEEFGSNTFWVRPLSMFVGKVQVDGKEMPRFEYVGN